MKEVPAKIMELVERFEANCDAYKSGQYNETQVRREFVDPFFEALGWDIDNKQGYAEAYKDVVHEDAIKIGGNSRAPDYCFRVGGTRKFFLEAKRPSVNVKDDEAPSFQLRRYGWSAKLPLSILTDFEELAVFDCRVRPVAGDRASTARTFFCTYRDYAEKWSEIAAIFSRDSILKGSFDKYADDSKSKRGTQTVDDAFLEHIEKWRLELARTIALHNKSLSTPDLNFCVQRTIDRIVFLRICEDRGIEQYGRLLSLANGKEVYKRLCEAFRRADEKYNSGLFHFGKESTRHESPDLLTPFLVIQDGVVADILKSLYYPESPYEFSVISSDILGQVYEQFLGKVIRLTPGHQAKIEEKPEIRKAGGVYYTPQYVVDYVVRATVGQLLTDASTPKTASTLRILDPACGSGSFLLGAYQYLLDWHRNWYLQDGHEKHSKGKRPSLFRDRRGEWQLTTAKRKELLQNNLFGVDLDAQAVEVTKLSLLLKVLEGETEEALNRNLKLFEERALPDLGKNIQCGNSLIGPDYEGDDSDEAATNPFDWATRFPGIFSRGGFDVVIGNPPYLSYGGRQFVQIPPGHTDYFNSHYESSGWPTSHSFFIERSVTLLAKRFVSFIVPDQVGHLAGYRSLREVALKSTGLVEAKYWGEKVFKGVTTPAMTIVLDKETRPSKSRIVEKTGSEAEGTFSGEAEWTLSSSAEILAKLRAHAISVRAYIADCGVRTTEKASQVVKLADARGVFIPTLEGSQIGRYRCEPPTVAVRLDRGKVYKGKNDAKFTNARYLIRQTAAYPIVGPHEYTDFFRNSLHALYEPDNGLDARYFVGLLNSKVIRFAYVSVVREASQRTFPQVKLGPLGMLPIRAVNLARPEDKERHDKVVALVERLLTINRKLRAERNPSRTDSLRHQLESVDAELDRVIYALYSLTELEVVHIEEFVSTLVAPP